LSYHTGNPYIVNSSGNIQQAASTKTNQSPNKIMGANNSGNENVQFTTAYIQVNAVLHLT